MPRRIQLDPGSFRPGYEESGAYPESGQRSHASQIFQLVAVNDATQRRPNPQFYRQEQVSDFNDTGERMYDAHGRQVKKRENGADVPVSAPGITCTEIAKLGQRLTNESGYVLVHPGVERSDSIVPITSQQQLVARIQELKRQNKLPATIMVDSHNSELGGSGAPDRAWHVVFVTDYDPKTGALKVSNQWGSAHDKWIPANCKSSRYQVMPSPVAHQETTIADCCKKRISKSNPRFLFHSGALKCPPVRELYRTNSGKPEASKAAIFRFSEIFANPILLDDRSSIIPLFTKIWLKRKLCLHQ